MGVAEPVALQSLAALVDAYARRAIAAPSRLAPLWAVVDSDLARPWTLKELAALVYVTPEQLRRICRRELGCSPMRHVTELRIRESTSLLASEFNTVERVASLVGYENAFAFSTAFKRHVGVPPSAFRIRGRR
jgi:transcriptional regulator GlxA family with amidase domain